MSVWFISRHPGALAWARSQGLAVDHWVAHLEVSEVASGDVVIGTLPVQMAATVCARGGRYFNLSLDLPLEWRGRELSVAELTEIKARLEEFAVHKCGDDFSILKQGY